MLFIAMMAAAAFAAVIASGESRGANSAVTASIRRKKSGRRGSASPRSQRAIAIASRLFDVWVMLAFGLIGFVLREMKYPMAPLVLGIILGDLLDLNLRRGLLLTQGDPTPFFTPPISMVIWINKLASIQMSIPAVSRRVRNLFTPRSARPSDAG